MSTNFILGLRVDTTSYDDATDLIAGWAAKKESRYVCVANVHMVMEAFDSQAFRRVVNGADLVTPDGMPLVWALRLLGFPNQSRVYGPDLTLHICKRAAELGLKIGLYGGTPESLVAFQQVLSERFPGLNIACAISPPFRPLTDQESREYVRQLTDAGAEIVLVGIGCPKQENWMAEHKHEIPAVMIGVGAAFDFHSGRVKQAPAWMQKIGLEWFFRFLVEPGRLWKRYLRHNPRFVILFLLQLLGLRRFSEA